MPNTLFISLRTAFALALILLAFTLPAVAHPRKEAETEITYNPNTDKVEIVHRFRLIDAENAVQNFYDRNFDIVNDPAAQASFGEYVEERFTLKGRNQNIVLNFVGGEIDDGWVWIYQETDPLPEDGLYILRADALMDLYPKQVNIVNVRLYDEVQTFILNRTSPWIAFRLDGEAVY